jgi:hypothetical protein
MGTRSAQERLTATLPARAEPERVDEDPDANDTDDHEREARDSI